MGKNLAALAAFYLVLGIVVVTSFQSSSSKPADFTFVNDTEPQTLDPGKMTGQPEGRIAQVIFEGLTVYHPKTLEPLPGVAESWDVSPDGRRYEFKLRENSYWVRRQKTASGYQAEKLRAVTAGDFVYAWRRVLEPETASQYSYLFFYIKGALDYMKWVKNERAALFLRHSKQRYPEDYANPDPKSPDASPKVKDAKPRKVTSLGELSEADQSAHLAKRDKAFEEMVGVKALSPTRLEVQLIAPTPFFLDLTCFYPYSPVNKECVESETTEKSWTHPDVLVTNGAFYITEWKFNYRIRMSKNEHYWEANKVELNSIDALAVEDAITAVNLYVTGVVDWVPTVPLAILPELQKLEDDFHNFNMLSIYFYRCNCDKPVFNGPNGLKVRQALTLALNRSDLVANVTRAGEAPAFSIVPQGIENYQSPNGLTTGDYASDLKKAQKLLAEAGYPNGKGFPKIKFLYNTSDRHKQIATAIQNHWKQGLNVEIELVNQEWASYQTTVESKNYQMARAGWIGDYTDPNTFLDMWITDGPQNNTGWSDPRYDRLIAYGQDIYGALTNKSKTPGINREQFLKDLPQLKDMVSRYLKEQDSAKRLGLETQMRRAALQDAEKIFARDVPAIPIYTYTTNQLWRKELDGLYPNLRDTHILKFVRWKEPKAGKK